MKTIKIILLSIMLGTAHANSTTRLYPLGCHPVGFSFSENQLHLEKTETGQTQTLYLLHNASLDDIVLETPSTAVIYLPHYKKTLPANHWAAFARDEQSVLFICKSNNTDTLYNCEDVIQICNYERPDVPTQNKGTYWLQKTTAEQAELVQSAIQAGILPR